MPLPPRVAVAYSAGRDSTALLHATLVTAASRGFEVVALHVHHGLSRHADVWLEHGRAQCGRWSATIAPVRFVATRVAPDRRPRESVEAWARRARYRALAEMATAAETGLVLLAHHQRDQAETLLLQALRGGGVAGLAAMPHEASRNGIVWRRPWLAESRPAIDAYLAHHRLDAIHDESNDDPRHDRNRLRLQVWPPLVGAFPQAERSLARSAEWAQQASELLEEVAIDDLAKVAPQGGLQIERWLALSAARRANALRAWLRRNDGIGAPATRVTRLMTELALRASARWPVERGELRLSRGLLELVPPKAVAEGRRESVLNIAAPGCFRLPGWAGELRVEPAELTGPGIALAALATVELRARRGGERFSSGHDRPARALKKQFQQAGVPAWRRDGPLVYAEGRLVFVPGLGLEAGAANRGPGALRMRLGWFPWAPGGAPR